MARQPFLQGSNKQPLAESLQALSAREQISFLLRATRRLSGRERGEVWRVAGLSVLRDRFLPVLLHVVLKKVLAGAFWWVICGMAVVLLLLVLGLVDLINSNAVGPVFTALVSFFLGFFLFAVFDFLRSLIQFFRSTRTRREREDLFLMLNACDDAQKLALLRLVSASLARKVPGESLLESLLMGLILAGTATVLVVLLVLLSGFLPALGSFPQLLLVAGASFSLGLLGLGMVQHRFLVHRIHQSSHAKENV